MPRVPSHPSWARHTPLQTLPAFSGTVLLCLRSLLRTGLRAATMVSSGLEGAELCRHPKPFLPFPLGFWPGGGGGQEKTGKVLLCQRAGFSPGKSFPRGRSWVRDDLEPQG